MEIIGDSTSASFVFLTVVGAGTLSTFRHFRSSGALFAFAATLVFATIEGYLGAIVLNALFLISPVLVWITVIAAVVLISLAGVLP